MKKNKLYTVTKYNRPAFMPYADYTNSYKTGGEIVNGITDKLGSLWGGDKLMSGGTPNLGGSLVGALGTAVGGAANKILSGGLNSGAGNAVANIGGMAGGLVGKFNPLLGAAISAGTGIIGGGINALFGSKVDEKKLAAVNADIARGNNFVSKAGTFEDIKGPAAFMTDTNVYKGGLLRDMSGKNNELAQQLFDAKAFAERSVDNNINNIWGDMVSDAMYNYSAYGGPLNSYSGALGLMQNDKYIDAINNRSDAIMGKNNTLSSPQTYFGDGGGIHIKKANEGKFTAQAKRAGMGVQEYASHVLANKDDYPASTVRRANFAHVFGGRNYAFGGELGTNGADWTNGLLYVDEGGTHEQNPLGGVPVGFDQNGTPNLVEEGETIWNDYVFSNRIKVPKSMFHTLGLGGAMKKSKLTFADASKKLAKESEQRPNDPISMAGLEMSLSKLAAVQEAERMKKQMRESAGLENMAAYGGLVNRFDGGGSLEWLKEHYPNQKNLDLIADAMEKMVTTNVRSRQFAEGKNRHNDTRDSDYALAFRNITRGQGNILSPDGQKLYTRDAERGREHFNYLKSLGLPNDAAFELAFPQVDERLNDINSPTHNIGLYREMQDRRNQLYNELITGPNRQRVIDSINGVEQSNNTPTIEGVLEQVENADSPEVTVPTIQDVLQQEAARNGAPQAQRGITVENTSSGTGYTGTPEVRSNRNNGFTEDRAFAPSLNDMYNGTYGFTPSNGAQYIPYTGMSEADVRAVENDPRFQRWTNYVLDNFDNKDNATVQNYLQWLDRTAGGNHMFDAQGNLLPGARDYYTNARTQNHLMGYYHLTPENWEGATQEANPQTSGYTLDDNGKLVSKEDYLNVDRATSPGWISPEVPDKIETPQDTAGASTRVQNDYKPLPTWMRYAPVVGGALGVFGDMLGLTNKPDYTYADRLEAAANAAGYAPQVGYKPIGDYERYTPFDRLFYANQLQANARGTDRMLANTSSPSRAAGLLANAYNTNNALGNLYRQGDEYNLAQYQQVKDFNRKTNMFNSQMGLEADIANARYSQAAKNYQMSGLAQAAALRDSIDQRVGAARSANLTNFFNSLGNIGRENFTFNQINTDPTRVYRTRRNGTVYYDSLEDEARRAKGGKLKRNK